MKHWSVKFSDIEGWSESIELIISSESIYSLVVKAEELRKTLDQMHESIRWEIAEITLLTD